MVGAMRREIQRLIDLGIVDANASKEALIDKRRQLIDQLALADRRGYSSCDKITLLTMLQAVDMLLSKKE
jgi:hypothetical protein